MDIQNLKNFLILANTLNFRRASEEIFIAQPALSRQIQQLEEEIGALLFKRDKRNVELTEAGHYFRAEVSRILHQFEEATKRTSQIHRGEAGEIKIGHASSAMQSILPKILLKIREKMPNLKTLLIEDTNRHNVQGLINREIDVAFFPNAFVPPPLASRIVYQENFVVLLPKNHPISAENFTDLSVFAKENFILPPKIEGIGYVETIEAMCQEYGFTPQIIHVSAYSGTVLRLVEAGLGISIEPKSTLRGQNLDIKFIELSNVSHKVEMKLAWLKEREEELTVFFNLMTES